MAEATTAPLRLAELLLGSEPDRDWHTRIADAVGPAAAWGPDAARHAIVLTLTCPEAQLA